jgi:hypothetical protein
MSSTNDGEALNAVACVYLARCIVKMIFLLASVYLIVNDHPIFGWAMFLISVFCV